MLSIEHVICQNSIPKIYFVPYPCADEYKMDCRDYIVDFYCYVIYVIISFNEN